MKCKYVYVAGDNKVKSGEKQVGDVCNNKFATPKYGGYCVCHAIHVGAISPEQIKEIYSKRQDIINARKVKKRDERNKIAQYLATNQPRAEPDTSGRLQVSTEVLDAMGLNSPCDLVYEYKLFKSLNMDPSVQYYDEKMAFARWLETPEHLRIPQSLNDVADILGVNQKTLYAWRTSPDIINFINGDVESRIGGLYKMCIYRLGEGINRGDKGCMELFLKHHKEKQDLNKAKRKGLKIPADLQREADDFASTFSIVNHGDRGITEKVHGAGQKAEKDAINSKYFSGTLEKKEEIAQ